MTRSMDNKYTDYAMEYDDECDDEHDGISSTQNMSIDDDADDYYKNAHTSSFDRDDERVRDYDERYDLYVDINNFDTDDKRSASASFKDTKLPIVPTVVSINGKTFGKVDVASPHIPFVSQQQLHRSSSFKSNASDSDEESYWFSG